MADALSLDHPASFAATPGVAEETLYRSARTLVVRRRLSDGCAQVVKRSLDTDTEVRPRL